MSATTTDRGAPVSMDPRIAARRDEVALAGHRRRRRWWLVALAAVVVVMAGWSLSRSSVLDVDEVVVEGQGRTTVEEALSAAGIAPGQALVGLDASGARDRLRALPWVRDAGVDVGWGGTVRITLTERAPMAVVADASGTALVVDADGRVLGPSEAVAGLVPIEGLAPVSPGELLAPPARGALAAAAALEPGVRSRVAAIVVTPEEELAFRLLPSGEARLGAATEIEAKVRSLQAFFAQVVDWCVVSVDLRVPDQVAVARDQACLGSKGVTTPSGSGTGSTSGTGTGSGTGSSSGATGGALAGAGTGSASTPTTVAGQRAR